jgi:hypothetical protein
MAPLKKRKKKGPEIKEINNMERLGGNHFTRLALCVFLIYLRPRKKRKNLNFVSGREKKRATHQTKKIRNKKLRAGNVWGG